MYLIKLRSTYNLWAGSSPQYDWIGSTAWGISGEKLGLQSILLSPSPLLYSRWYGLYPSLSPFPRLLWQVLFTGSKLSSFLLPLPLTWAAISLTFFPPTGWEWCPVMQLGCHARLLGRSLSGAITQPEKSFQLDISSTGGEVTSYAGYKQASSICPLRLQTR